MSLKACRFQLFASLEGPEYEAFKEDIRRRGVLLPLELDQDGELLDGFNRRRACEELGIEPPTVVRHFDTEEDRLAHVIALNLKRRHLDPVTWGEFFQKYCEARGAKLEGVGSGDPSGKTATLTVLATELGVPTRTARRRLEAAHLPGPLREKVRAGSTTLNAAKKELATKARIERGPPPLPVGTYQTIVADPPWKYERGGICGTSLDRVWYVLALGIDHPRWPVPPGSVLVAP